MIDLKNTDYKDLSDSERKKLQKQFHENDLNYFSSFGIEAGTIDKKELEDLNKRIDKRVSGNSFRFNSTLFIGLIWGIFIGAGLFFLWPKKIGTQPLLTANETTSQPKDLKKTTTESSAEVKKESSEHIKEHFHINQPAEQLNLLSPMENMEIKDINSIAVKEQALNAAEEVLNYIPNSSVIFIYDLKVANYKNYYFKDNRNIDIRDNGLSAQFANKEEVKTNLNKRLEDRDYYAHEIIKDAMQAYNKKQFTVCIDLLNLLYGFNKSDVNAQFYLGMSFYNLGDFNKAMGYFNKVSDNAINIFLQEAEFYTALCYKNTNKTTEAKELFKQIANKKMFYAKRAEEELN